MSVATGLDLHPHQQEAVQWLLERPRGLLADDVGLGKTLTTLGLVAALSASVEPAGRSGCLALVLVPGGLVEQWLSEAARFAPEFDVRTDLDDVADPNADLVVVGIEKFRRASYDGPAPHLLIVDEAGGGSGVKTGPRRGQKPSQAWLAIRNLAQQCQRAVALTATPLEGNPTEPWSILRAIGAPVPDMTEFFHHVTWTRDQRTRRGVLIPGSPVGWRGKRGPQILAPFILRRTAEDIGLHLPTGKARIRYVQLSAEAEKKLKAVSGEALATQELAARDLEVIRDAALAEVVKRNTGDHREKVVLWVQNPAVLSTLRDWFTVHGVPVAYIDGATQMRARARELERFNDPCPNGAAVLLGTDAIAVGLNLQVARVLVSVDMSWNPAKEAQREGRIRRLGSDHKTYEHIVILPQIPLSSRKQNVHGRKRNAADELWDAVRAQSLAA